MAAGLIDSEIFRDLFGTAEMREVFSDEQLVRQYLSVEGALATVQGRLGIIPPAAAAEIRERARLLVVNFDELRDSASNVGYPIAGLVRQIARACRDGAGEYVHWGATTQDIMDTAVVLQVRDAIGVIERDLAALAHCLTELAVRHRDTPMAGRTHLQHALPITFGYKCAVWLSGLRRHQQRLLELKPRVLVGQFAGAVGTLAALEDKGLAVQEALMHELGLGRPDIPWHVARDCFAETVAFLGLVTATLSKVAYDVMLLMMSEIGELAEPYAPSRGSSSTMPQKHNPIACEMILACGRIVRQNVALMLDATVHDFERATGAWHVEWHALPQSFVFTGASLRHAQFLLNGLQVNAPRMRDNLDVTRGLIMAEAVVMWLAKTIGRQSAYDLVYEACREAREHGKTLHDVLATNRTVAATGGISQLAELLKPERYVGAAPLFVDRATVPRVGGPPFGARIVPS